MQGDLADSVSPVAALGGVLAALVADVGHFRSHPQRSGADGDTASDIADLLFAEGMDGWATEVCIGGPAYVLQLVLDQMRDALGRSWHTPINERAYQLELSRVMAGAIPQRRVFGYQGERSGEPLSGSGASIDEGPRYD